MLAPGVARVISDASFLDSKGVHRALGNLWSLEKWAFLHAFEVFYLYQPPLIGPQFPTGEEDLGR